MAAVDGGVANAAGTKFLCSVAVPALSSPRMPLGDRGLFCAVSLPDEFQTFW